MFFAGMNKSYGHISTGFSGATGFSSTRHILWSTIAVIAGGIIYMLFRPTEALFLNWFSTIGMENWLESARENSLSLSHNLPNWFVYSLPNGLWAYAYTLLILIIWKESSSLIRYFWYLSIPVLIVGFELLQLTGTLQGTFCLFDLSWGIMGIVLGVLTVYLKNYKLNLLK
jgi:hypothetical protein